MDNFFPERFTILLRHSKMSYEEVAHKLNLKSKSTISKYANGKTKKIQISMVVKIAELFGVSPIWLLGFTEDMFYVIKR